MYLDNAKPPRWTIGVGFNLSDRALPEPIIDALLAWCIDNVEKELDAALPWWRQMNDARQNALANMAFQLGLDRLLQFRKTLQLLQGGKWEAAADEALNSDWARQVTARAHRVTELIRKGTFQ